MGAGIQWQRIAQRLVGVSVDLDLVGRQAALRSDSHGSHPVRVGAANFYTERRLLQTGMGHFRVGSALIAVYHLDGCGRSGGD